jgi:hypothetical protein
MNGLHFMFSFHALEIGIYLKWLFFKFYYLLKIFVHTDLEKIYIVMLNCKAFYPKLNKRIKIFSDFYFLYSYIQKNYL